MTVLMNFLITNFLNISTFLKKKSFKIYATFPEKRKQNIKYLVFFYKKFITDKDYKTYTIKNFNLFKIGILLGFFIDAFKVGS